MTHSIRPVFRNAAESPIRAMLALAGEPDMISLAGGHPDPTLLPRDWFAQSAQSVIEHLDCAALQYGATEGIQSLRESVCALLRTRRIVARPDELLVTTGSQQAISLLASVLLDPGDAVALAPYNYPAALQAVRFAGASIVTLNDDAEGFEALPRDASMRPIKALYIVPNFANPTGHIMSLECRLRLLQEAARRGICVIEDDPYGELWFERPPPDSLCALNQNWQTGATVAYVTSFSKIVLPAFRLGVLFAPPSLRHAVKLAKQAADVHSGLLEQRFLDAMLRSGRLPAHLISLRAAYGLKARAMTDALRHAAADILTFREPAGGMFVWAELSTRAARAADIDWFAFGRAHRVLALPGSAFAASEARGRYLRLSFANPSVDHVREGVRRLAAGLTAELADGSLARLTSPATARC